MCEGNTECGPCAADARYRAGMAKAWREHLERGGGEAAACSTELPCWVDNSYLSDAGLVAPNCPCPDEVAGPHLARALARSLGGPTAGAMTNRLLARAQRDRDVAKASGTRGTPYAGDWQSRALDDVLRLAAGRGDGRLARLAGMLATAAVSESGSGEEAARRFLVMTESLLEKAERGRAFERTQAQAQFRSTPGRRFSGGRINPATMQFIPGPEQQELEDAELRRETDELARARAEREEDAARAEAVVRRVRAERPRPPVAGAPQ